jgi:hypothetical protein
VAVDEQMLDPAVMRHGAERDDDVGFVLNRLRNVY